MITVLPPLCEGDDADLEDLQKSAASDDGLACENRYREDSGDVRYWNPDTQKNRILSAFRTLAEKQAAEILRLKNPTVVLMLNYISAETCPIGSGGGWHVDSVRTQHKIFCYLTDCIEEANGPLTLLSHPLGPVGRAAIYLNWLFGGKKRFSDAVIKRLKSLGFSEKPILLKAGQPFRIETSQIHRGKEITKGERIMLTAYIYDGQLPDSVKDRLGYANAS